MGRRVVCLLTFALSPGPANWLAHSKRAHTQEKAPASWRRCHIQMRAGFSRELAPTECTDAAKHLVTISYLRSGCLLSSERERDLDRSLLRWRLWRRPLLLLSSLPLLELPLSLDDEESLLLLSQRRRLWRFLDRLCSFLWSFLCFLLFLCFLCLLSFDFLCRLWSCWSGSGFKAACSSCICHSALCWPCRGVRVCSTKQNRKAMAHIRQVS